MWVPNLSVARQVLTRPCTGNLAHMADSLVRVRSRRRLVKAQGTKPDSTRGSPVSALVLSGDSECVTVLIWPPLMLNHRRDSRRHLQAEDQNDSRT